MQPLSHFKNKTPNSPRFHRADAHQWELSTNDALKTASIGDAMFHTVDSALRFAFDVTEYPILSRPQLSQWMAMGHESSSMSPHDWHAQGALIKLYILTKLGSAGAAYVFAFYARGQEKEAAISWLLHNAPGIAATVGASATVEAILRRYVSNGADTRSLRQIASKFGCSVSTAHAIEARIKAAFTRLFADTDQKIRDDFRKNGLVMAS